MDDKNESRLSNVLDRGYSRDFSVPNQQHYGIDCIICGKHFVGLQFRKICKPCARVIVPELVILEQIDRAEFDEMWKRLCNG